MNEKTILVMEDEAGVREALAELLRLAGWQVVTAADGHEGQKCFAAGPTNIIVSDLVMPPGPNGLQAMATIRMVDPKVPFIILTAYASAETQKAARDAGATAVLQKPIEIIDLVAVIDRAIANRKASSEAEETIAIKNHRRADPG